MQHSGATHDDDKLHSVIPIYIDNLSLIIIYKHLRVLVSWVPPGTLRSMLSSASMHMVRSMV